MATCKFFYQKQIHYFFGKEMDREFITFVGASTGYRSTSGPNSYVLLDYILNTSFTNISALIMI